MACVVSSYIYSALLPGQDSIRLLCLLPHDDKHAQIRCQLIDVRLGDLLRRPYPYEALSYVWGDPKDIRNISINGHNLPVTRQLHEALSSLQYHHSERILWVDAICIDQAQKKKSEKEQESEKEQQIRLMPKIYSQANSVIVWLGEKADDSDRALQAIVEAGRDRTTSLLVEATVQRAIIKLLQRSWFRRIWVLQEVGTARHIRIKCGRMEIDGHAFCLGVDSLRKLLEAHADLQNRIRSISYLIRGAIFRVDKSGLGRVSKGICALGELIDMYHAHEASVRHDKVYALLGMSSDDIGRAELFPNYQEPWGNLLQRLAKFVISDKMSVEARPNKDAMILRGKGCVLGIISSVDGDLGWDDRQSLEITWRTDLWVQSPDTGEISSRWTIQDSAKTIQKGDLICHFVEAARFTIIRLHEDFSAVIVIAAQPPQFILNKDETLNWLEILPRVETCTREFTLVWDWDGALERLSNLKQFEAWMQYNNWRPGMERQEPDENLEKASRCWNLGLALGDIQRYEAAEGFFERAIMIYEKALRDNDNDFKESERITDTAKDTLLFRGEENRYLIHRYNGWTPILCVAKEEHKRVFKLLFRKGQVDVNANDRLGKTLLSVAAEQGNLNVVERLLEEKADVNARPTGCNAGTALQAAAGGGYLAVVERLLEEKADVNAGPAGEYGRTALQAAAEGGHLAVVERLIQEKAEVNDAAGYYYGRTALQAAAGGGHLAVVERLIQEKAEVNAATGSYYGRMALEAAAEGGHLAVVERLLQEKAEVNVAVAYYGRTALQAAAEGGYLAVIERLLQEKAEVNTAAAGFHGKTALQAAAGGGHLTVVERLIQEKADVNAAAVYYGGRTALQAAAEGGHLAVVERLLQEKAEVNAAAADFYGKTALQAAAGGGYLAVVERLLQEKAEVNVVVEDSGTALQAAVAGGHLAVVKRLRQAGATI